MSLEHFKKQVLLLHSEQSTLDNLSSGFNDRYTVHCATSGSEALNTLGETQIDVIVSAQELPGMSGLDALREAKKRSPDTIGILLAGNQDDGLEALVGDQEVFQIVRGGVTAESLRNLIDGATRQARLMALAESANDMAANPDEPVAEHIVMETSENGSTIISDGTGRHPILNPQKVAEAADVGTRSVDVLVVTQDDEFLGTVRESARGLHNVIYANTLQQADDAVRKHKVGVAVVDAAMVGGNVEKITMHLRSAAPRLVAIVAGRRDDGEMLMDLINRGKVYRFLLKPVSPGRSRLAIEASVKHHLEAPDSAFARAGAAHAPQIKAAPKPAPKSALKAAPRPNPRPTPKPAAKPEPRPVARAAPPQPRPARPVPVATKPKLEKPKAAPARKPPAAIVAKREDALSPIEEGLSDAFDDKSFTETVTGVVQSISSKFSKSSDVAPRPASADSGGSLLSNPKILGLGAVAVVVIIAISFWLFSGWDGMTPAADTDPGTASVAESESLTGVGAPPLGADIDDMIEQAQLAADAGRVFNPPGSNAIELYLAALDALPGDPSIEAELAAVIEGALAMAENALLDRRIADAAAALDRVGLASPDNPRLPFLNAQLAQLQLRDYLDGARVAIRENRFEDAARAIANARGLTIPDPGEIDAVARELTQAQSQQQVDDVLAQANSRLEEGMLVAPSNDNARYYFELALSNDPGNTIARQGLSTVASKLVLQARTQIDQGNFDVAGDLLAEARRLDPTSSEVAASTDALQAARDRQEQERVAAEQRAAEQRAAERRAAAEKAAAERAAAERAAAEKAAAERAAAEKAAAERAAEERAAAERRAAERLSVEQAAKQPVVEQQQAPEPVAEEPVAEQASVETFPVEGSTAQETPAAEAVRAEPEPADSQPAEQASVPAPLPQPVSVSSLQRTKYVAPKYPRPAQRRGISGWVDVVFTVDIDGTVTDIAVRDSNPGDTFVSAATRAVEDWEFEPVIENGVAIQKRAAVRMMFAIE